MAKGFVIILRKDEYNDSRYKFLRIEQIDCDTNTIITKGKSFGYKLDKFTTSQVINLDASKLSNRASTVISLWIGSPIQSALATPEKSTSPAKIPTM